MREEFDLLGIPLQMRFMHGSGQRLSALGKGRADFAVLSAGAAASARQEASEERWIERDFGAHSYYSQGPLVILMRPGLSEEDGEAARTIGIDRNSYDARPADPGGVPALRRPPLRGACLSATAGGGGRAADRRGRLVHARRCPSPGAAGGELAAARATGGGRGGVRLSAERSCWQIGRDPRSRPCCASSTSSGSRASRGACCGGRSRPSSERR